MTRKRRISIGIVVALMTVLTDTAVALSSISFTTGSIASYDFGAFGPGFSVPATMQIQKFTLKPGETIPWHFHKGVSYVILSRGTLTEKHLVGPTHCESEELTAGSAFVESPGQVHNVTNTGQEDAVISWSTIFPKSDGIVRFNPEFKSGGIYVVTAPNCK
jgi:mannose-6-phosphate isomerase-like protein (cupin superfamily)